MIIPLQRDRGLLADIRATQPGPGHFSLWWLGQSGFLFKSAGACALIDPYLSDSLTKKYAATDRPHVRMTARCLDPHALGFINLVLATHGHSDHLDPETLLPLATARGRRQPLSLVLPRAHAARAAKLLAATSARILPIDVGESISVGGIIVTAMPAAHPTREQDAAGNHLFLGYLLRLGRWLVYHSGDTLWEKSVVAEAVAARPDVALLPINGAAPERGVAGNLDGTEAAKLAKMLNVAMAIPCHFEMFEFNTATPGEFVDGCRERHVPHAVLRCGQRWDSADLAGP